MDKELLLQRIESLKKDVERGAGELNKLLGRIDEAQSWLHYLADKEQKDNLPEDS
jgi:hypothetical protein